MTITDITGKKSMKAVDVFAFSIEYIKESIFRMAKEQIGELEEEDAHWVVTVPAIWDEAARQFMIDAANKVYHSNIHTVDLLSYQEFYLL